MKDSQGNDIVPGNILGNPNLRYSQKISMVKDFFDRGLFAYLGKFPGKHPAKVMMSQKFMNKTEWVKVG